MKDHSIPLIQTELLLVNGLKLIGLSKLTKFLYMSVEGV